MTNKETLAYLREMISNSNAVSNMKTHTAPEERGCISESFLVEKNDHSFADETAPENKNYAELYKKAHAKVERLLVVRDRSTHEIRKRLAQENYPEDIIEALVTRCIECGLLDDIRFAETLIRSRLRVGKGIIGITHDLRSYGIDERAIPGYPDRFLADAPDQFETAKQLLESHPPTAKNKRQAAYAKLVRKGFSSDIAQRASRVWCEAYERQNNHEP